jgi:hypothetical protein
MSFCPNKSSLQYKTLVSQLGEIDAYNAWYLKNKALLSDTPMSTKPGVQELFDSNPELANQVYEALGFKSKTFVSNFKNTAFKTLESFLELTNPIVYNDKDGLTSYIYGLDQDKEPVGYRVTTFYDVKDVYDQNKKFIHIKTDYDSPKITITEVDAYDYKNKSKVESSNSKKEYEKILNFIKKEKASLTNELPVELIKKQQALQVYSQYLDSIFPDSKVKDIVYHGTNKTFDKFDKKEIGSATQYPKIKYGLPGGFYFTKDKEIAGTEWGSKIMSVIINLQNPDIMSKELFSQIIDGQEGAYLTQKEYDKLSKEVKEYYGNDVLIRGKNSDGVIIDKEKNEEQLNYDNRFRETQEIVFEPEQIHILGSKQDIEGFKEFVKKSNEPIIPSIEEANNLLQNKPMFSIADPNIKYEQEYKLLLKQYPNLLDSNYSPSIIKKLITQINNAFTTLVATATQSIESGGLFDKIKISKKIENPKIVNEYLIERLQKMFPKTKVKLLSIEEAYNLIGEDAYNANSFILKDTVYILRDKINNETIIEEFLHPFVEYLFQNNNDLYLNLEKEAMLDETLKKSISSRYSKFSVVDKKKEMVTQKLAELLNEEFKNKPKNINELRQLLQTIYKELSNFFYRVFGGKNYIDFNNLSTTMSLDTLVQIMNTEDVILPVEYINRPTYSIIDDIKNQVHKEGFKLKDDKYVDINGNTYERLTEWVRNTFSKNKGKTTLTFATYKANAIFKKETKTIINGIETIKLPNGVDISLEDLIVMIVREMETAKIYGTLAHKMMDICIKNLMGINTDILKNELKTLAAGGTDYDPIDLDKFDWIEVNIERILAKSGIIIKDDRLDSKQLDKIESELPYILKELGIGTTIDGLLEHNDGYLSIRDWKTGRILNDQMTSDVMLYGDQSEIIRDSKLDRAKLEVVLRALMIKYQNPTAKFRQLSIEYLNRNTLVETMNIDLDIYLAQLHDYFRENDPKLFEDFKNKGLFDKRNYGIKIVENDEKTSETKEEQLKALNDSIAILKNQADVEKDPYLRSQYRNQLAKLSKERLDLEQIIPHSLDSIDSQVGWYKKHTADLKSVAQPIIQSFSRLLNKNTYDYNMEVKALHREFDVLQKKLMDEHGVNFENTLLKYKTKDNTGLYDFMWVLKDKSTVKGYFKVTPEDKAEWAKLTDIQKEYINFFTKNIEELYNEVGSKVVYKDIHGYKKTNFDIAKIPKKLESDFMPRTFMDLGDFIEVNGVNKSTAIFEWNQYKRQFFKSEFYANNSFEAMPFKNMGSDAIIGGQMHSFNAELAFKSFTQNLIKKKHLDEVHNIGVGLTNYFRNENQEENAEFLESRILIEILDAKLKTKLSKKVFSYVSKKTNRLIEVDSDAIFDTLRNAVTAGTMWLKPGAAAKNAVLLLITNHKKGLLGSISKQFGVNPDDIDFSEKDLLEAELEWAKMQKNRATKTPNKLDLLLKEFNYLPEYYDFAAHKSQMMSERNKLLSQDNLYLLHAFFEDWGTTSILTAMLIHQKNKKTGKNIYDSYEVEDGKLVWKGGIRGKRQDGTLIEGITYEEMSKYKKIGATLTGNYRKSERGAIELYALGRVVMQFKRFVSQQLYNLLQSKQELDSYGKFIELTDENGNVQLSKDGETIYSWKPDVIEGRYRVMLKFLLNAVHILNNPSYNFKNLSARQKQEVISTFMMVIQMALTAATYAVLFDDDEEETFLAKTYLRLVNDLSDGMYPTDMLNNFLSTSLPKKAYDVAKASSEFLFGITTGERTQKGYVEGELQLAKNLPIFSSIYEIDKINDNIKNGKAFGLTGYDNDEE